MKKELLKEITILYVEDEDDVREFTARTLSAMVKKIVQAKNGKEGLDLFQQNPSGYDVVVTDINMPKLNGLDMSWSIKTINRHIPIVVTTAHSDAEFLKKAIEVGVSTYAMKPIDLYQLLESIINAVEPTVLKKELEKSYINLQEINLSLEDKIQERLKQLQSILDSQDNIIVVTDGMQIDTVNKKFLEFFGYKTLNEFKNDNKCVCERFIGGEGYFSLDKLSLNTNWVKYILSLSELERAVKMKNVTGVERLFTVNIDDYEHKGEHYVISFTDVTELKQKAQLLEYQANHDSLTGLLNRQKFSAIFAKELRRDKRYDNKLSVIMFDIDNFKHVNDSHGHDIGDSVLKNVALLCKSALREHDNIARWGGEEFMIMLPETSQEGACAVAEKVRSKIEQFEKDKLPKITCSFGVVQANLQDSDISIFKRVDEALYEAKNSGKNKVIFKI